MCVRERVCVRLAGYVERERERKAKVNSNALKVAIL